MKRRKIRYARSPETYQINIGNLKMWCTSPKDWNRSLQRWIGVGRNISLLWLKLKQKSIYLLHCPFLDKQRSLLFHEIGYRLTLSQKITNYSIVFIDLICNYPPPNRWVFFFNHTIQVKTTWHSHLTPQKCKCNLFFNIFKVIYRSVGPSKLILYLFVIL